jgi:hypothetical protein
LTGIVIKNGTILNHAVGGISLPASRRSTVRGVAVRNNGGPGIEVGPISLVKDCIAQRNLIGVEAGDGSQVEGCTIGGDDGLGNDTFGLLGGSRLLVTRNAVIGNGLVGAFSGIAVGGSSTVTHNTANGNAGNGIAAGDRSLVTQNTTNENGVDGIFVSVRSTVSFNTANENARHGISASCPSTITHNTATGNDGVDINPIGPGCVVQNNNTTPPPPLAP